jgi:hypothetical protein
MRAWRPDWEPKRERATWPVQATLGVVVGQPLANVVSWRVEAASDNGKGKELSEFADSLRDDMSHTWDSFRRCSRSPTR